MQKNLKGRVDGELSLDLHGNFESVDREKEEEKKTEGITGAGTYVLRNGKLVQGEGMVRQPADFSNWYCSNADPEDIRRHRELQDRMNYKGPQ